MAVNIHSSSHDLSRDTYGAVGRFGRKLLANVASFQRNVQMARMTATLSGLTDAQLSEVGIARCDIPAYAERLMETS